MNYTQLDGHNQYGDIWVIRTDADGDTLWTRTYGALGSDRAFSVLQTDDYDGYIVAGETSALSADRENGFVMKIDTDGNQDWMTILGEERESSIAHVIRSANGDYVAVGGIAASGRDDYDAYFARLDKDGTFLTERLFGGSEHDYAFCIRSTSDNGFVIVGSTESFAAGMGDECYLIKTDADGMVTAVGEPADGRHPASCILHQNYPNPFNPTTTIRFTLPYQMKVSLVITDALGREVWNAGSRRQYEGGRHSLIFDTEGRLPSGVYFYRLETPDVVLVRKMVLMR